MSRRYSFISHFWVQSRSRLMSAIVLALMLLSSLLPDSGQMEELLMLLMQITVVVTPLILCRKKAVMTLSLAGGVMLLIPTICMGMKCDLPDLLINTLTFAGLGFEVLLTGYITLHTLTNDLIATRQRPEPIFGCILTYLLIGVAFATVERVIALQSASGAFLENGVPGTPSLSAMIYFSFTTLATCGYGDIVPLLPIIRMIAVFEMISGVMFIALFVGLLLGRVNSVPPPPPPDQL